MTLKTEALGWCMYPSLPCLIRGPLLQDVHVYAVLLVSFGKQFLFNHSDYKQTLYFSHSAQSVLGQIWEWEVLEILGSDFKSFRLLGNVKFLLCLEFKAGH